MKTILRFIAIAILFGAVTAHAQNWATVSAANITDLNQNKLAAGQLCFLGTDQNDNPINFGVGGGGQVLKRAFCSTVTNGAVAAFTVPNPANTQPAGIYYRITVKDTSTGQEVLRYPQVTFSGTAFNFDNYAPANLGSFAPLSGNAVSGNLSVSGNISATGSVIGANMPASTVQTIDNSGSPLPQRTVLNAMAGLTCSDNSGAARTDCRLGTLTTVSFSATPTFDASTASTFKLTLTGNVTSSTLSNAVAGQPISFEICQDSTGGRTFVAPANVLNFVAIPSAANACIFESFVYDGSNAQADQSVAALLLSPGANPASAGVARLASGDAIDWRNNANAANIPLAKTGAASGGVPADTLDASGFGGLKLASPAISAEATAPSGVAGSDVLYADSAAHRWKMINNNGSADTLLGAATSDIVSNKTLTGAVNGNAVTLLNEQGPTSALTGNSTDQTIYTYTLPANTLGAAKGLRVRTWFKHSSGTASVTYKLFFGATAYQNNLDSNAGGQYYSEILVFNNSGVTNAQHGSNVHNINNLVFTAFSPLTSSIDTTAAVVIKLTFNVASTDQVAGGEFIVELIQ